MSLAAKQNDMIVGVDVHIIMIPTPGGPVPTPLPHPFMGMLDTGLSTDVKIDGQFAAIVGSEAHAKPPHIPQGGPFQKPPMSDGKIEMGSSTVFINGKPAARMGDRATTCNDIGLMMHSSVVVPFSTVIIGGPPSMVGSAASGESSSGSGSGTGDDAPLTQDEGDEPTTDYVEFHVQDGGGSALKDIEYEIHLPDGQVKTGTTASDGKIREDEMPVGAAKLRLKGLHDPAWGVTPAAPDEEVELRVGLAVHPDGTKVDFEIYREGKEGKNDAVTKANAKSSGGVARAKWKYKFEDADKGRAPRFVFHAVLANEREVSGPLTVGDTLSATLEDTEGKPLAGQNYLVFGCDGQQRRGVTDEKAKLEEKGLAFGKCVLRLSDGVVIREVK